jgi:photosystem II stability/assembly factor-like uncharacterized protein
VAKHTTDGGGSWTSALVDPNADLRDIVFTDSLNGWIAGHTTVSGSYVALIYHTVDGGATWPNQAVTGPLPLNKIAFADNMHGWATSLYGNVLHTSDGGESWELQGDAIATPLRGLCVRDSAEAWVCGDNYGTPEGILLHTTDGGEVWTRLDCAPYRDLAGVEFTSADEGWLLAGSTAPGSYQEAGVLHTVNGGATWTPVFGGVDLTQSNLSFLNADQGWICGQGGMILHYGDPLAITTEPRRVATANTYSLLAYPNPFNPTTTISFDATGAGRTRVVVYDVLGQVVRVLGDQVYSAGTQRITLDGSGWPTGCYYLRLESQSASRTERLLLLK